MSRALQILLILLITAFATGAFAATGKTSVTLPLRVYLAPDSSTVDKNIEACVNRIARGRATTGCQDGERIYTATQKTDSLTVTVVPI